MDFKSIEKVLGYEFSNKELLKQAFVRASYTNEQKEEVCNNEILEFYGDSILNIIVIKLLFEKESLITDKGLESSKSEESLSNAIRYWTCKNTLSKRIDELDLARYLISSSGDIKNDVNNQLSVKEDLFEALVCSLWIDSNYNLDKIKEVIVKMLDFKFCDAMYEKDVFTVIKEWCDKNNATYTYKEDFVFNEHYEAHLTVYKEGVELVSRVARSLEKGDVLLDVCKQVISYLNWNHTKKLEIQFDWTNATSRLNELIQKKIITVLSETQYHEREDGKIVHFIEYDTLEYGYYKASGFTKSEAKTYLALSILVGITGGISDMNKHLFDKYKK